MKLKHLDLFSGIGGFALASERVWPNIEHIFCDNDDFCQAVLKKHWPNSKIYGDIRTLIADPESIEQQQLAVERKQNKKICTAREDYFLLTGGFPCQPFSQAGRRKGTSDDRYLWPAMFGVIRRYRPLWVVAENVAGLVTWNDGLVLETVCSDLEKEGYEVQPFIIPASAVQAPHRRDRVWIIAKDSISKRCGGRGKDIGQILERESSEIKATRSDWTTRYTADSKCKGYTGEKYQKGSSSRYHRRTQSPNWEKNWPQVASRLCRVDDGVSKRLDRNSRIHSLGNAIVPQVAEEIFKIIKNIEWK